MLAGRRLFIERCASLASLALLSSSQAGAATSNAPQRYPFRLGVASGAPLADSVILWTRILDDPLEATISPERYAVRWEIAEDERFHTIVAKGIQTALPELAHSLHVDVGGLRPDRWYWYRFLLGDAVSPVGRTRTAPAADALPGALRFAFASCQHWEFGEYGAHRHIAAAAPDLVAFLGDYIYEWGPYDLAHPATARRSDESFTLSQYRARYAQYKTDAALQAAHHAAPWIVTWDDHEVANDYGNLRDERLANDFAARRAAAYQAFYEHMPVRVPRPKADAFGTLRLYDRLDWGRLVRFHVLDDRQYRDVQSCPKPGRGGSNSVTGSGCPERLLQQRTLLGTQQEAWLAEGLATSPARWNILAQQTLMAQASQLPVQPPENGRFWTDGWDGYPAARRRLLTDIAERRPANPVVLSGDVHTFYAADLKQDFDRKTSATNPIVATEFCGTSITSSSQPQARIDRYLANNPHLRFGRSDRRGFVLVELQPKQMHARFQALDDVHRADSGISTLASFVVDDGKPGVQRDR